MAGEPAAPDYVRALLVLMIADREDRLADGTASTEKTEVLLGRAGVPTSEIAKLTGKNVEAVRKTLQRAKR